MHRILLTGSSGTLGRNFLDLVAGNPLFEVQCLLREQSSPPKAAGNVTVRRIDFSAPRQIAEAVSQYRPTTLVHCAATGMEPPKPPWSEIARLNIDVSVNFCEAIATHSPGCHFIFVSTGLVYRNQGRPLREDDPLDAPYNPYGATKAAADILLRSAAMELNVPLTVLRPFSFTGIGDERGRLFPTLLRAAAVGHPVALSSGAQSRDHCSARDIARGILAATGRQLDPAAPEIYNLGSGDPTPLRELIRRVVEEIELEVELQFGARPAPKHDPGFLVANVGAARDMLEWAPAYNLAHAVWELAQNAFPSLKLRQPSQHIS